MQYLHRRSPSAVFLSVVLLSLSCGEPTASAVSQEAIDARRAGESAVPFKGTSNASAQVGSPPAVEAENRFAPGGEITDAQLGEYYVEMTCEIDGESVGTLTFDMWTEEAPITTRNFLRLCDEGFYNGLTFHRVIRDFMIQGGDPQGNGLGGSPHGTIKAEFSEEPGRRHGYGVLSMARGGRDINSASSQFFLCCDESQSVWGLDGKYASFGKLTSGVKTLEAVASVPVVPNDQGRVTKPKLPAKITEAKVIKGTAPTGEKIERPEVEVDLGGEPQRIKIQQILIGFKELAPQGIKSTLTEAEAKALAAELKQKIEGGADMSLLVREHSDLPFEETDKTPGDYRVLNTGVRDRASERKMYYLRKEFGERARGLQEDLSSAKLTRQGYQEAVEALQEEFNAAQVALGESLTVQRAQIAKSDPLLAASAFGMKVGEVIVLEHDPKRSSLGYRVVKRLE